MLFCTTFPHFFFLPFLMQTDNSYRKIPPIKLHVHFIISILKTYYFKRRFGRIRNTIIKKITKVFSLLCIPDVQRYPRISHNPRYKLFSHSLLHLDTQVLTSHIGKMLLSIWRYCYNRRTESLLDMFFLLVTLKLWEPHEMRRIENSVEEKMGIEKIGESGMNFWLQSLHPLLPFVTFVMNSFPIHKRRTFWKV